MLLISQLITLLELCHAHFFILGLIAYPQLEDGSTVISFDPTDYSSYGKYFENIQHQMKGIYLPSQRAHDIKMTSYQRRIDVDLTSF